METEILSESKTGHFRHNEDDYLQNLAYQQKDPILLVEREPLAAAMRKFGAKGLSVADVLEPFQMHLSLYIGVTTPGATTEVPHWHNDQTEAYVIIQGQAELSAKHRWIDDGWTSKVAHAGDMFIVQPQVCHWFRWISATGLALVFKAPQRAGVGSFPAGKVVCKFCPHFNRGCKVPQGFTPHK